MINITKDRLFGKRFEKVTKVKNNNSKIKTFIKENQSIIILIASFLVLAISNGFLVYSFFKTLSKL